MPRVLNARHVGREPRPGAVYIGRPSEWGNPFVVGKDGSRDEVIARFIEYLCDRPDLIARARLELHGKDLVCWCAPHACHGDILLSVAAGEPHPDAVAQRQSSLDL